MQNTNRTLVGYINLVVSGLSGLLGNPTLYNGFQMIVGAMRAREIVIKKYLQPKSDALVKSGYRILDIGCGTGYVVNYLPNCHYVGFDTNAAYINYAKKKYGIKGEFHCNYATKELLKGYRGFDCEMMNGLIHHLDDSESVDLLSIAKSVLKDGGAIVGIDGCYKDELGSFGRWMLNNDRGKFVRDKLGYELLLLKVFKRTYSEMREDLFMVPYNCLIWKCINTD
jgi:SAM-dependent methyltransferase